MEVFSRENIVRESIGVENYEEYLGVVELFILGKFYMCVKGVMGIKLVGRSGI